MSDYDDLVRSIAPLAKHTAALQKQAKALGLFTHDRELLLCDRCGLMEDVTITGMLITCPESDLGPDTGLRFEEVAEGNLRCPACDREVRETLPDDDFQ